jgi:hypothetical protein
MTETPKHQYYCTELDMLLASLQRRHVLASNKVMNEIVEHITLCQICQENVFDDDVERRLNTDQWIEKFRLLDKSKPRPPLNAEFILHIVLPDDRIEDAVGDLDERFGKKVERLGIARANFWYYKQVACSLWPYAKAAARRLSSGLVSQTIVFCLRVLGQNGLAEEIVQARAKTKTR